MADAKTNDLARALRRLAELFEYAMARPGYGSCETSREEAAAEIERARTIAAVYTPQPADVPHDVVRALEELVALVEADCIGDETADDPDEDSVGWDGSGNPLPMTFGHVRRARAAITALATPAPSTSTEEALRDTDRLNWLIETGAHLSWTKDSEMCRVWFPEQWDGSEARAATSDHYVDPRQAIDDARQHTPR